MTDRKADRWRQDICLCCPFSTTKVSTKAKMSNLSIHISGLSWDNYFLHLLGNDEAMRLGVGGVGREQDYFYSKILNTKSLYIFFQPQFALHAPFWGFIFLFLVLVVKFFKLKLINLSFPGFLVAKYLSYWHQDNSKNWQRQVHWKQRGFQKHSIYTLLFTEYC